MAIKSEDPEQNSPLVREWTVDEAVDRYLLALARHPFVRRIEVDSEHFVADFEAQWPVDPGWEDEALELGGLIADLAYPMLDRVKARYGVLTVWVGAALKPPPAPGNETALRAAIDATQGILRYRLTEPHNADDEESVVEAAAEAEMETPIAAGLILMCQPLGSNYHRQRSAVGHWVHQHGNLFGWTQLALNRLYDLEAEKRAVQEAEAAREAEEIRWLRARFRRLMRQRQKEAETAFWEEESEFTARSRRAGIAMVAPQAGGGPSVRPPAVPGIPMPEKMAEAARAAQPPALALPPNLRALEERLLAVAAAPRFSPEFRTLAHELAQELRAFYPTALVEEAAFAETARMPWVRHEETVAPAVILMPIAGPTPSAPAALARAGAAPAKTAPSEGAVREAEAVLPTGPAPTPALPPTAAKPEARAILATPPTQAAATPAQTPTAGVAPSVPQPGVREIPAAAGEAVARAEAVQPAGVVPTEAAVRVGGAPSTTGPAPTAPTEVVSSTRTIAAQAAVPTRAAGAPPEKERLGPTVAPRPAAPGTRPETVVEVIAPTPTVGTAPPPTGVREIPAAAGPTPAAPTARMETAAPTPAIEVRAEFAAPSAPGPHVAEAGPTAAPVMPAASRPAGTPTGGTASPVTPAASPPTAAPIALQPAAKPAAAVPAPPAPTAPVAPAMPAAPATTTQPVAQAQPMQPTAVTPQAAAPSSAPQLTMPSTAAAPAAAAAPTAAAPTAPAPTATQAPAEGLAAQPAAPHAAIAEAGQAETRGAAYEQRPRREPPVDEEDIRRRARRATETHERERLWRLRDQQEMQEQLVRERHNLTPHREEHRSSVPHAAAHGPATPRPIHEIEAPLFIILPPSRAAKTVPAAEKAPRGRLAAAPPRAGAHPAREEKIARGKPPVPVKAPAGRFAARLNKWLATLWKGRGPPSPPPHLPRAEELKTAAAPHKPPTGNRAALEALFPPLKTTRKPGFKERMLARSLPLPWALFPTPLKIKWPLKPRAPETAAKPEPAAVPGQAREKPVWKVKAVKVMPRPVAAGLNGAALNAGNLHRPDPRPQLAHKGKADLVTPEPEI